jgi:hypothetical protein
MKRMRQAMSHSSHEILGYNDRLGVAVPFGWASELIPEFQTYDDSIKEYVTFYIWPGNTKEQGRSIFNKSLNWTKKKSLSIDGNDYELEILYNVKLCHFNRYVSGINFQASDLKMPLHTKENYDNKSGLWRIDQWDEFEKFLDSHFLPEFDWRGKCQWENKFKSTDRNYFTMSLGFEVAVFVPFSEFKAIDKKDTDFHYVSRKVDQIANALKTLV